MSESDLIQKTADTLHISIEEVKRALEIYKCYSKIKGRMKQVRKRARIQALAERRVREEKAAHPEKCFCDEDGIPVDRSNDEILRYKKDYYGPFGKMEKPTRCPVYKCSNCGKEYMETIVWA